MVVFRLGQLPPGSVAGPRTRSSLQWDLGKQGRGTAAGLEKAAVHTERGHPAGLWGCSRRSREPGHEGTHGGAEGRRPGQEEAPASVSPGALAATQTGETLDFPPFSLLFTVDVVFTLMRTESAPSLCGAVCIALPCDQRTLHSINGSSDCFFPVPTTLLWYWGWSHFSVSHIPSLFKNLFVLRQGPPGSP